MNQIKLQLVWIALVVAWNVSGVWLLAHGQRSPGPTASLTTAIIAIIVGVVLVMTTQSQQLIYVLASFVAFVIAAYSVWNAFTADPTLWPSDFWRYVGVAINSYGAIVMLASIFYRLRN